jgi:L-threonylcarbamoyladenylate synthase
LSHLHTRLATRCLRAGGVIAYPTEAVWGVGCDPWNEEAVYRLLEIKQRPVHKGLILVAASLDQLAALYNPLTAEQKQVLGSSWPGPNTWLIPDPDNLVPDWIKGEHSSVAIRVSAHPLVRELCLDFQDLIVSTSANLAGQPEIRSRLTLQLTMGDKLDFVVPGALGGETRPSAIRDLKSGLALR